MMTSAGLRTRWTAIGAAIAVALGGGVSLIADAAGVNTPSSLINIVPCRLMDTRPGGDNVGCGDAYLAILIHGMTLGWDLAASGLAASRWAAEVAGVRGATPLFDEAKIDDILGEIA